MSEREGFLAAIAAAPDDDALRLIFADWLDEHDDPLGEFIRLQIELEPLRRSAADPAAEHERMRLLERIPPGEDFSRDDWPLAQQLKREAELLGEHRAVWLGSVAGLEDTYTNHFQPEFRRGFVASAVIGLTALRKHGEKLRRDCPALQRLAVSGTLGHGEEVASCAALAGLPELVLAGWLTQDDATRLAASPHLASLRSLTYWIGSGQDEAACRALTHLPGLRELTLVQMWGGIQVDDPESLDRQADELAAMARAERTAWQVRVERPFARRFPLDGIHIGYGLDAGHLPSAQAVLVLEARQPIIIYFDTEGRYQREQQLDLREKPIKPPAHKWEDCNVEELIEVLGKEIGFKPGPIFVREFFSPYADVGLNCWGLDHEELASPATTDPEEGEGIDATLYRWWSTAQYELPYGNSYWADGLGRIHSS